MPRGRPPRPPSGRNLALYHEVVSEGRTQREVAQRFGVSQPRVARVVAEIRAWTEHWIARLPPDLAVLVEIPGWSAEASRFHVAVVLQRQHLQRAYSEYLQQFGGLEAIGGYGHLLSALDAGVVPAAATDKLLPRDLLASAVRMARELNDLAEIAQRGPLRALLAGAPNVHSVRGHSDNDKSPEGSLTVLNRNAPCEPAPAT
jgi:hypothetical protein